MRKAQLLLFATLLSLLGASTAKAAEAYAVLSSDKATLTFYYDNNKSSQTGTVYSMNADKAPGWYSSRESITKVVFNSSFASARPTSCYSWFYGMKNLASITGLTYLNTSEVTNMFGMFYNCSTLTSLDVSKFNTAKVTNMTGMFYGCSGVKVLNISNFSTSNVTIMRNMFYKCSGVTTLDVSKFNTSNVTDLSGMFTYCSNVKGLNVKSFVTTKSTDFKNMFFGCDALTSLDLSSFTFSSSVSSSHMIACQGLTWLAIPSTANNIASDACETVGKKTAPCELSFPSGFTPQKTSTGSGWYQWKTGYFKDAPTSFVKGDVDHNGEVEIADVMITVDVVLKKTPYVFYFDEADIDGNNEIEVADVMKIVDIILHKQ